MSIVKQKLLVVAEQCSFVKVLLCVTMFYRAQWIRWVCEGSYTSTRHLQDLTDLLLINTKYPCEVILKANVSFNCSATVNHDWNQFLLKCPATVFLELYFKSRQTWTNYTVLGKSRNMKLVLKLNSYWLLFKFI